MLQKKVYSIAIMIVLKLPFKIIFWTLKIFWVVKVRTLWIKSINFFLHSICTWSDYHYSSYCPFIFWKKSCQDTPGKVTLLQEGVAHNGADAVTAQKKVVRQRGRGLTGARAIFFKNYFLTFLPFNTWKHFGRKWRALTHTFEEPWLWTVKEQTMEVAKYLKKNWNAFHL